MNHRLPQLSPTVLTIAGSDPSGGAGIQADLKTMTAIGVYGAAAITCITVQNSRGVTESVALDGGLVVRQVQAVLSDHHVTHIKIGMVGTLEIASALGELLASFQGEVIYDPVLTSTTGQSLLSCSSLAELSDHLISKVTVLTPNCLELAQLCQQEIATPEEALACARLILARHTHLRAVIVKGGHLEPENPDIHDYLVMKNQEIKTSKRVRIRSANLHGTGCTYASAFAAFHCRENDYDKAFFLTSAYMDRLINAGSSISQVKSGTNGPLVHAHSIRREIDGR
jgi:hydroxymethylpyrimidine kinase/phosphomethylpyrimidine kinase